MSVEELVGSELSTKEYWEQNYTREIKNYKDHGDFGEIWFDEDSQIRVINWIARQNDLNTDVRIVDLGCGNGMLLVELAREGYDNLLGIDYSSKAIELAKNIANDQKLNIAYKVADLMDINDCITLGKFDIVHDKGTYDSVSLSLENPKEKRELYMDTVWHLMHAKSIYIITSCNWTEDELVKSFEHKFKKAYTIPTPCFKFAGKVGNVVTSLVFKKKEN